MATRRATQNRTATTPAQKGGKLHAVKESFSQKLKSLVDSRSKKSSRKK